MEEPVATPALPPPIFKAARTPAAKEQLFSSSPGFGTPAYPIAARPPTALRQPFAPNLNTTINSGPAFFAVSLPPQTLRPVAFRTLTKKHNLTLTSSGLGLLAAFVGKFCGNGWREEGLAERALDEVAKQWKRLGGGVIVEDGPEKKLSTILRDLGTGMSGGRIDAGKLSRISSSLGGTILSRQNSLDVRPDVRREDSQTSLGLSGLDFEDDCERSQHEDAPTARDARTFLKVVSAFTQPRLAYSMSKKSLELASGTPSLLPPTQRKIAMFRNRYHLIHQRLMRNESFQTPTFSTMRGPATLMHSESSAVTVQQAYKITPISNMLGRSGKPFFVLGMLANSSTGDLAITDLSGSVVIDMSYARSLPEDSAWFCPGMIVLVNGVYEEDGSNSSTFGGASGVGGQIKGRFVADAFCGPPAEKRDTTLGLGHNMKSENAQTSAGAGFGWVDFLGVGSEKAMGSQMRRIQRSMLGRGIGNDGEPRRSKVIMIGECYLDSPRTLEGIRAILTSYAASAIINDRPLSIVFMGNFVSAASMAGSTKAGGSVEYKEHFDALASVLSEFPALLSSTTFVFVPGDNDPWASSFSAGAAAVLPRQGIPELFTSRIRRAIATANNEANKKENDVAGEAVWTSNPARMSLFGPVEEIVLFRDDITGRFRRNAVTFSKAEEDDDDDEEEEDGAPTSEPQEADNEPMEVDIALQEATSRTPNQNPKSTTNKTDTATARKLVKTILDQAHLAPFPPTIRPALWDYASSLTLYPLPTALVLADAEAPAFSITYEDCHVMNPGRVLDELGARKGIAKWMEYDVRKRKGLVKDIRF